MVVPIGTVAGHIATAEASRLHRLTGVPYRTLTRGHETWKVTSRGHLPRIVEFVFVVVAVSTLRTQSVTKKNLVPPSEVAICTWLLVGRTVWRAASTSIPTTEELTRGTSLTNMHSIAGVYLATIFMYLY